jgi:hypothetical protein
MTRLVLIASFASLFTIVAASESAQKGPGDGSASESSRIQIGLQVAPVPLDMTGKNPALVGLGSYIVNAQADCNGCHAAPPAYAVGGNPFLGQPEVLNGGRIWQVEPISSARSSLGI